MIVSVIIPTFNRADRVVEAIKSVQRQTYPHMQIIVVDDGSTDDTKKRVQEFENVEYFYQENQRQGAARNYGLSKAKGDYIATLDSDDVWNENFLTNSIECLEKQNLDFVFSNWKTKKTGKLFSSAWELSKIWQEYTRKSDEDWFLIDDKEVRHLFIRTCPAPSSALLIRRKSLNSQWNTKMKIADDWCLVLEMVVNRQCRAAFTLKPLWTKSVHTNNIYDGNRRQIIASELEIHDTKLMKQMFASKLTFREKMIFNSRIAKGNAILAAYFLKNTFITREEGLITRTRQKLGFDKTKT